MENQNSSRSINNKLESKTPDDDAHININIEDENPLQNLNNDNVVQQDDDDDQQAAEQPREPRTTRTPFTNLSQIDSDLALARTLQEQERAYMMLMMNNDGSDDGSWETGSYQDDDDEEDGDDFSDPHNHNEGDDDVDEDEVNGTDAEDDDEDEFHVHTDSDDDSDAEDDTNLGVEFDPEVHSSDEAYARALQEAEERELAVRLFSLTGISDRHSEDVDDHSADDHDAWDEVDPDELSYEELLALGDVVGTESRGLSDDTIASLPSINYKAGSSQNGSNDSCVICRLDYEDSESLTVLSCKHSYHPECINNWLKINKVCPVCSTEVSTSGDS